MRSFFSPYNHISICVDRPINESITEHQFVRRVDISQQDWESSFKFGFVRNPYDRFVSTWHSHIRNVSFKDFTLNHFTSFDVKNNTYTNNSNPIIHHFSSLLNAKYLVKELNFIGRFEKLQEDFNIICNKLKIPLKKLSHRNKSNRKHYKEYYCEETIKIVTEKYYEDITYFGYEY